MECERKWCWEGRGKESNSHNEYMSLRHSLNSEKRIAVFPANCVPLELKSVELTSEETLR